MTEPGSVKTLAPTSVRRKFVEKNLFWRINLKGREDNELKNELILIVCSSIPFTQYNGEYCKRKKIIQNFEKQNNCSMLALFGTTDLISDKPVSKVS